MKRFFAALLLGLGLTAYAEQVLIKPEQLETHAGFSRKTYCANGAGEGCGSNPPKKQLTTANCGEVISTSTSRNEDGSNSTEGILYNLPTVQMMQDAGFFNSDVGGQSRTCMISFVAALPLPSSYVNIGIEGVQGVDKITFNYEGTFHDIHWGYVRFPAIGSAPISVYFNGTSWLAFSGAPSLMAYLGYGSMASQGQGRLFLVTSDPSWWSVGSKIGSLAFCRLNGMGITSPSNGGIALNMIPSQCSFIDSASGSLPYYITFRHFGSYTANGIAQGAAYGAGTAPNGTAYAAGNYVVITNVSANNFASGNTVIVHNIRSTLGTRTSGKWIAKLLTAPATGCAVGNCFELHEEVREETDMNNLVSSIGPPSSFIPGDSLHASITPPVIGGSYEALTSVSAAGGGVTRRTNPANGSEEDTASAIRSIVGMARTVGGVFTDTDANRYVTSWFNPVERRARATTAADRTTASAAFVEANADLRASFVFMNHVSAQAGTLGDLGRRVRYEPQITVSNDTAGGGCQVAVGFDGTTPEQEIGQMVNPGGVTNIPITLTLSGSKSGLTEGANPHFATILVRTNGTGTCKLWKDYTFNTVYIWQ